MQTKAMMQNTLEIISDVMEWVVVFPTRKILNSLSQKIYKINTARRDLSLRDSLHGSNADFIELQSDTKRTVRIILDLSTWHVS